MNKLIEQKRRLKRIKPSFIKQDAHKKKRLDQNWRRPRGIDSKMRLNLRGYRRKVKVGYGTPDVLRHKDSEGRTIKMISNVSDLEKSDPNDALVITASVGMKKRMEMAEKAVKMKRTIVNIDVHTYIDEAKKRLEKRKALRTKLISEKDKKQKTEEKKPKSIEEKVELSEDDKKKLEKEEKDKVLRQDI